MPGKSLNIWTNYENGKFMGYRAKDGSVWNVAETAVDSKGSLWYKVGTREWIEARYTVDVNEETPVKTAAKTTKKKSAVVNLANKVKQATQKKKTTKADKVKKANQIVNETVKKTTANKKNNTSSIQASSKAASVVALAKEQVGKPYVWGATGPDKFDCSGLVQYVYQHAAGINLPRTTYDQVKVGQTVPLDKLQAGDLVFWGSETAPYHVAIYIGNNQYVNSATPDQGTILQNMSSYYYPTIAKRVL
ncbi:cell wall-associated hydrolase [Lactobacillus amylovorus DSM 20531]|nr:cell wall-associated hydrolase [Lactobacillus amylovorus DSM 20531]